ncbi:MAG: hypothetical protein ACE5NC_02930 [Anaerolineae bacterium]
MELREKIAAVTSAEPRGGAFAAGSDPIEYLDRLEAVLTSGRTLPRMGGAWVDRQAGIRLIGRLRASLPGAALRARKVLQERDEIMVRARSEAQNIATEAGRQAEALVEDSRLIEMAEIRSKAIVHKGEARAQEVIRSAQRDASALISQTEHSLDLLKSELREIRIHYLTQDLEPVAGQDPGETDGS